MCKNQNQVLLFGFLHVQTNIYLFKFNNRNTRKRCKICSGLTRKTPKQSSGVFTVDYEYVTLFFSVSIVDFEQVNVSWGYESNM